jgi:acyl-CoA dehydrogenase
VRPRKRPPTPAKPVERRTNCAERKRGSRRSIRPNEVEVRIDRKIWAPTAVPDAEQQRDLDLTLVVGHLFTLVVYGQLILEQSGLIGLHRDLADQIFDFQIRDFSGYAIALHGKPSSTPAQ